ncbi:SDR family NAD(P)-dependent oxidoreductase [Dactylosporangium sucinum]|nr:SDR family oxidoreductase [Dactylosporangium sucinum]
MTNGTVLVTGASRGIGAAIATRLAQDGYGVVVNYAQDAEGATSVVREISQAGGRAAAVQADVADAGQVAAMFEKAGAFGEPLVGLVNNAGSIGQEAPMADQRPDALARLVQTNVVGPALCAKHAIRAMSTKHGGTGGSIVNLASVAGHTGGLPHLVPYAATKGAVIAMTKGLASEVAEEGIRVNSVSPGIIDTEMSARPSARQIAETSPMGRMGHPGEVAAAVSWLVSNNASFVTGTDLTVSGGR